MRPKNSTRPTLGPEVTRLLLLLSCYFFLLGLMQSLVSLRGVEAGLDAVSLGLMLGLASGSLGLVLDMPVGRLADLLGKRRILQFGLWCSLAASLLMLSDQKPLLICGAVLAGLGVVVAGAPLLSWLGSALPPMPQARLQGLNGTAQRVGALLAVAAVGLAIGLNWPAAMPLGAAVVSSIALLILAHPVMRAHGGPRLPEPVAPGGVRDASTGDPARSFTIVDEVVASYLAGYRFVVQRRIVLAGAVNVATNVIFLVTNSYIPLVDAPNRAWVVTGTLVTRDLVAAGVGVAIAAVGIDVTSRRILVPAIVLASAATWASSYLTSSPVVIFIGALQGVALAVGIAAANLFAIDAAPTQVRTLAMAASFFQSRVMFLILPIGCSLVLGAYGLPDVFRLLALMLLAVAVVVLALGGRVAVAGSASPGASKFRVK